MASRCNSDWSESDSGGGESDSGEEEDDVRIAQRAQDLEETTAPAPGGAVPQALNAKLLARKVCCHPSLSYFHACSTFVQSILPAGTRARCVLGGIQAS
jgi:hypothetical protein